MRRRLPIPYFALTQISSGRGVVLEPIAHQPAPAGNRQAGGQTPPADAGDRRRRWWQGTPSEVPENGIRPSARTPSTPPDRGIAARGTGWRRCRAAGPMPARRRPARRGRWRACWSRWRAPLVPVGPSVKRHRPGRQAKGGRAGPLSGPVAAGPRFCQTSRPMAAATSAIRAEKPHSLSYHDSTRTMRRPTTRVWSGAKIEDCVVWLKSIDTFGSGS